MADRARHDAEGWFWNGAYVLNLTFKNFNILYLKFNISCLILIGF
jgi:hypothetical protein